MLAALASAVAAVLPAAALAAKPALSTPPIISVGGGGAIDVGDTLTTTNGVWTGAPSSYSYDWQICDTSSSSSCFTVGAADANNYAVQTEDAWYYARVVVRATNAEGSTTAASAVTGLVQAPAPGLAPTPDIDLFDSATEHESAYATIDPWDYVRWSQISFQWQRETGAGGWADISGATDQEYVFQTADVGKKVRIRVSASTPSSGGAALAPAVEVGPIAAGPPWTDQTPALFGTFARDGETVTVTGPNWLGALAATSSYQWERCNTVTSVCSAIPGATAASYRLTVSDIGSRIRAAVIGTNAVGSTTVRSGRTQPVGARIVIPPPTPSQPLDSTAPEAKVTAPKRMPRLAAALKSGVTLDIRCSEACAVAGKLVVDAKVAKRLKIKGGTVGKVSTSLAGGRTSHVTLRFDKSAARKLRRLKSLTVTLKGTVKDGFRNSAPLAARLTLKR